MANHITIMIHTYSRATGKSIHQAMKDLNIEGLVGSADVEGLSTKEKILVDELASDVAGVMAWRRPVGNKKPLH